MPVDGTPEPWRGAWTYFEIPQLHPMHFQLTRTADRLEGAGTDQVGEFTFTGVPGRENGAWTLTKRYVGQHEVRYEATETDGGLVGRWFLQGVCGGSFALWPGSSETPPPPVLAAVPKVEFIPLRTRKRLILLEWGMFASGLLGLIGYAALPSTGKNYVLPFVAFLAYTWLSTPLQRWLVRRILRKRLGVFGAGVDSWQIGAPMGWTLPVTTSTILVSMLTVAGMLTALWFFHRKR